MSWRNHTRMFTPERIGLITLCTVFGMLLIALLQSQRDCSGADTRAAAIVVIDSIARQDTDTVSTPIDSVRLNYRKEKRKARSVEEIKAFHRKHLDEDIAR